jgi:hypothetical protein
MSIPLLELKLDCPLSIEIAYLVQNIFLVEVEMQLSINLCNDF